MSNDLVMDNDKSWAKSENMIGVNYECEAGCSDMFMRLMGPNGTSSLFNQNTDIDVVSALKFEDGTYCVFYDDEDGIPAVMDSSGELSGDEDDLDNSEQDDQGVVVRGIFSKNSGVTWVKSDILLARNAFSGYYIFDEFGGVNSFAFIYITGNNVLRAKLISAVYFQLCAEVAVKKDAGENVETLEVNEQKNLDEEESTLIGSGAIELQRLSGYITPEGIYKIFYYTTDGLLTCLESTDASTWKVADNF